jgi:hypothetical protein
MTRHPEEGTLQAYLDGEVAPGLREELAEHLEICGACRLRLGELAGLAGILQDALPLIDSPAPELDSARWAVRRERISRRTGIQRRRLSAAASIALLFGVGLAAAVPGSPIRGWWEARGGEESAIVVGPLSAGDEELVQAPPAPAPAAVSVAPVGGRVSIQLEGVPVDAGVEVELIEGMRGWVTAPVGARFESGAGRIHAALGGLTGEIRVELPVGAPGSELWVNGESVLPESFLAGPVGSTLRIEAPVGTSPERDG